MCAGYGRAEFWPTAAESNVPLGAEPEGTIVADRTTVSREGNAGVNNIIARG